MTRLFKPQVHISLEDPCSTRIQLPDYIEAHFKVRVTSFVENQADISDLWDSEIVITETDIYQPQPYQLPLMILHPSELDQDLIWQFIYDCWFGIGHSAQAKPDEYTDLKKGIAALIQNGFYSKAGEIILSLKEVIEYDEEWLTTLAMVQYMEKKVEAAINTLREAYWMSPNHEDTLYNLGFMYKVNGEIRRLIYYLERLLKVTANEALIAEANDMLAECYSYV
ncbi:tetratricopeptide repeat protein [Paenibacillus glufosinatiresistens]|uniref:tetratricopeptide repeat protein n=1 Tax=Paenibacillus glufosinatiresistens TaxID=3070657 RepID=UPI00286DDB8D|nr:hypothetical protein [Paenibacillus sp. YX.27]